MFEDSVLENRIARNRPWTTLASFAIEAVGILVLVLIPLIYTEALPNLNFMTRVAPPTAPAPPRPIEVIATERQERPNQSEFVNNVLMEPQRIPPRTNIFVDELPPVNSSAAVGDPTIGIPGGGENHPVISALIRPRGPEILATHNPPTVVRVSRLDEGHIIQRVQPIYPDIARRTRTQGPVVLDALIGRDGRIEHLRVVSGHPYLITSAMDAVRQWRYRPYLLNGVPVEVQTTITLNFILN